VHASWTLAGEYGFVDADGSRPDWGAHFARTFGETHKPLDDGYYAYLDGYEKLFAMLK
jgi:hypothetical protein